MTRSSQFLLVLTLLAALTDLGCRRLDHFKVYKLTEPQELLVDVDLTDQFATNAKTSNLRYMSHFATPVAKVHGERTYEILKKDHHLTWYWLVQEELEPRRAIRFRNQLGDSSVTIGEPRHLLTPAQKLSDPESERPEGLDHYKCYQVLEVHAAPDAVVVDLEDQFGPEVGVSLGAVQLFCLPVLKEGHEADGLYNEKDHLAVYEIGPLAAANDARVWDQFRDEWNIAWGQAVQLCIPSKKLEVQLLED